MKKGNIIFAVSSTAKKRLRLAIQCATATLTAMKKREHVFLTEGLCCCKELGFVSVPSYHFDMAKKGLNDWASKSP